MHSEAHGENGGGGEADHGENGAENPLTAKRSYFRAGEVKQYDTRRHSEDENAKEYIDIPYPFRFPLGGAQLCFKNKLRFLPLVLRRNDVECPVYGGAQFPRHGRSRGQLRIGGFHREEIVHRAFRKPGGVGDLLI